MRKIKGGTFDCDSSLQNRLVSSRSCPADTGADSPSFPCSSAQRLRKSFSPVCVAKGHYRLGPFCCPKKGKETTVMQTSCPMKWGKRSSVGEISESPASAARHFQGPVQDPVPHEHIPVQKERVQSALGLPLLWQFSPHLHWEQLGRSKLRKPGDSQASCWGKQEHLTAVLCICQSCTVYINKDWDHTFHFKEQLFALFIDVLSLFIEPSARYDNNMLWITSSLPSITSKTKLWLSKNRGMERNRSCFYLMQKKNEWKKK